MAIGAWLRANPTAPVKRQELIKILDAIGPVTQDGFGVLFEREIQRRSRWRRLLAWLKRKLTRTRRLEDLPPEALDRVIEEVEEARRSQAAPGSDD